MKLLLYIYSSFFLTVASFKMSAQNAMAIDTTNNDYKNRLIQIIDKESIKSINEINKIEDRGVRKRFLKDYSEKKSDFDDLIKKGIFIEHPLYTKLVNDILQKIKLGNPDVNFDDIKLLLAINQSINAYNCGDGIVVINLPLIFNIDNQYDLAYIISHEIGHQKLNHVYQSMLKSSIINNSKEVINQTRIVNKQKYNKSNLASSIFKKIVYQNREESRKFEHEADSLGYIYFRNSYPNFDNNAIETLKELKDIDNVNDSLTKPDFVKFFEVSNLKFNEEWLASDISKYSYQKTEKYWNVDSLRTHPDCDARITYLQKIFKIQQKAKPKEDVFFKEIKANADNEYVFSLYFLEQYGDSLYYTLLKLKNNPSNPFLKKMIYDNLIKLSEARNNYTLNRYLETENPKYSESYNQFLCLIRNLRKNELIQIIDFYKH